MSYVIFVFSFKAASMKPLNSGWGRLGLDLSSGWAWVAMNQGWSGSSIISTIRPSGDRPESIMPHFTSAVR